MVAGDYPCRGQHITLGIGDGQNIAGFGALAVLVSPPFTAFLGDSMAPIQVQLGQIEFRADQVEAVLPDPLQAAIGTPFLPVIVDRLPTDLFFSGWLPSRASGSCAH